MVPVVYTCSIAWTASSLVEFHIISTVALFIYEFHYFPQLSSIKLLALMI